MIRDVLKSAIGLAVLVWVLFQLPRLVVWLDTQAGADVASSLGKVLGI